MWPALGFGVVDPTNHFITSVRVAVAIVFRHAGQQAIENDVGWLTFFGWNGPHQGLAPIDAVVTGRITGIEFLPLFAGYSQVPHFEDVFFVGEQYAAIEFQPPTFPGVFNFDERVIGMRRGRVLSKGNVF